MKLVNTQVISELANIIGPIEKLSAWLGIGYAVAGPVGGYEPDPQISEDGQVHRMFQS